MDHGLCHESGDVVVVEAVVQDLAVTAAADDGQVAELSKLVGGGGLADAQERGEVADAHLALGEGEDDAEAGGVAEGFEQAGEGFELARRDLLLPGALHPGGVDDAGFAQVVGAWERHVLYEHMLRCSEEQPPQFPAPRATTSEPTLPDGSPFPGPHPRFGSPVLLSLTLTRPVVCAAPSPPPAS